MANHKSSLKESEEETRRLHRYYGKTMRNAVRKLVQLLIKQKQLQCT